MNMTSTVVMAMTMVAVGAFGAACSAPPTEERTGTSADPLSACIELTPDGELTTCAPVGDCKVKSAEWEDGDSPTKTCGEQKNSGTCNGFGAQNAFVICTCEGTCKSASPPKVKYSFGCTWSKATCGPKDDAKKSADELCKSACESKTTAAVEDVTTSPAF